MEILTKFGFIIIPTMEKPVGLNLLNLFYLKTKNKINPIMSSEYPTAAKRPIYSVLDTKKTQMILILNPRLGRQFKLCLSKLKVISIKNINLCGKPLRLLIIHLT